MSAMLPTLKSDVRFAPARPGEMVRNYASIEKARHILGFNPKTQLNKGLRNTWQWFTSHDRFGALK